MSTRELNWLPEGYPQTCPECGSPVIHQVADPFNWACLDIECRYGHGVHVAHEADRPW